MKIIKMGHLARINTQNMEWKTGFRVLMACVFHSFFSVSVITSTVPVCSSHQFYFLFFLVNKGEEKEHFYNLAPFPTHPGIKHLNKLTYTSLQKQGTL